MEEVFETMEKIKAFEDSINTIWTDEQIEKMSSQEGMLIRALNWLSITYSQQQ